MNYRKTLNLPKTSFSMKANLVQREPQMIREWKKQSLHQQKLKQSQDCDSFVLHDGPPYANGEIHMGHALNKILKDVILRYRFMKGFSSLYIPGWDCHGLPIEHQVLKVIKAENKELSLLEKRQKCRQYAKKFVKLQQKQFERLGIDAAWDMSYLTMTFAYESDILHLFAKLVENNFIHKGLRPIHWCGHCETALAEAEIQYQMKTSHSIWVKFPCLFSSNKDGPVFEKPLFILIWTTTPWTISANLAVAVHPELTYVFVDVGEEILICAESRVPFIMEKKSHVSFRILHRLKGVDLTKLPYQHPFRDSLTWIEKDRFIYPDSFVSSDDGTGCVHIVPAHGEDDFAFAKHYNIENFSMVDHQLRFTKDWPEFEGQSIFSSGDAIVKKLENDHRLYHGEKITHSYPHCWRCHNPIVFRTTNQWFMDIDHRELRMKTLDMIHQIQWIPSWGKKRLSEMIKNRPSWCLSRQRFWGVPIPAFYCCDCGEVILKASLIREVSQKILEKGCDIWFFSSCQELCSLDKCDRCGGRSFSKETDILDVWFDSGCSYYHLFESQHKNAKPVDLYLEGSDQHRGWFQSSLLLSMAALNKAPFQTVLTHNFVVDQKGIKMSKSLGNVILPEQIIQDYGADVIRLFVASSDYSDDIKISQDILEQKVDAYRKIRNTCRFFLSNLSDFDVSKDQVPFEKCSIIDRWALSCLQNLIEEVSLHYQNYEFYKFYKKIYDFCIVDMSSFYLDLIKDCLYTAGAQSLERRSCQTVLIKILSVLTRLMAPVLVFTCEEIWSHLPKKIAQTSSVHLEKWPQVKKKYKDEFLEQQWKLLRTIRDHLLKKIEMLRRDKIIHNSLEVVAHIKAPDKEYDLLKSYEDKLEMIFMIASVSFEKSESFSISVSRTKAKKCLRCWIYHESVGKRDIHKDLCLKCCRVLEQMDVS